MASFPKLSLSRFRLERELGSGATGTVHEAILLQPIASLPVGSRVAVKFLHHNLSEDNSAQRRFLREGKAGLSLQHPNLIRVYAVEEVAILGQKLLYLVMEYLEGKTLRELLQEQSPLSEALVRNLGLQLASGLAALHEKGIVHHDVKPENAILTPEGRLVLMDLGFARPIQSISESQSGFIGSLAYAAPERIRGQQRPDPRSDLYSLGVSLYELAAGKRPFPQEDLSALLHSQLEENPLPPSKVNPRVSPFLDVLILSLLQKDPARRPKNAAEVAKLLEEGENSTWWKSRVQKGEIKASFHLRHQIPFHGRKRELSTLEKEWRFARDGHFRVLALEGAEGSGKSRLVDEFVDLLRHRRPSPLTLYGRSPRNEEPPPCAPFLAALERYLGLPSQAEIGPEELRRLKRLLGNVHATRLYDALRGSAQESQGYEEALAESFVAFLNTLSSESPVLLFLDDFSWAHRSTLRVLEKLQEHPKKPLMILLALRSDNISNEIEHLLESLEKRNQLSRLPIVNLNSGTIERILRDLFVPQVSVEDWAKLLEEHSGGNPGLLVEIWNTLRLRGVLIEKDGRFETQGSPRDIPLPNTSIEAIRERRDLLETQERGLLECAAVAGNRFDTELLAKAFDVDPLVVLQGLNHIERRYGLVVSAGKGFRFTRPVVRDILYQDLSEEVRQEAHRRLLLALEDSIRGKKTTPRNALTLANHASRAGEHVRALRYLIPLVEWMYARGIFEKVQRLGHLALKHQKELPEDSQTLQKRFDMLRRVSEAEGRLGLREEEKRDLEECASIARQLKDGSRIGETYFLFGRFAHSTGKYLVALNYFERSQEYLEKAGEKNLARESLLQRANVLSYLGDFVKAERFFEKLRGTQSSASIRLRAYLGLGKLHFDQGLLEAGLQDFQEASNLLKKYPNSLNSSLLSLYRGRALSLLGREEQALVDFERGVLTSQESGDRRLTALLEAERGITLSHLQQKTAARAALEQSIALAQTVADRYALAIGKIYLAEHLFDSALLDMKWLKQASVAAEESELPEWQLRAKLVLSRYHLRDGKSDRAFSSAQEAMEILRQNPLPLPTKIFAYFRYYGVLQALHREEEALPALHRALRLANAVARLSTSKKTRDSWLQSKLVAAVFNAAKRRQLL